MLLCIRRCKTQYRNTILLQTKPRVQLQAVLLRNDLIIRAEPVARSGSASDSHVAMGTIGALPTRCITQIINSAFVLPNRTPIVRKNCDSPSPWGDYMDSGIPNRDDMFDVLKPCRGDSMDQREIKGRLLHVAQTAFAAPRSACA